MQKNIYNELEKRVLVLDGAMGTQIQLFNLTEEDYRGKRFTDHSILVKGNNDLLVLTRPDIISTIHRRYLEAGADILETNTFNATQISMADYEMQHLAAEINREAAKLTRAVAD